MVKSVLDHQMYR